MPSARGPKTLGKCFVECSTRIQHTALICRQTVVCRVFFIGHSANSLPTVSKHSAKINSRQKKIDGMERRCRFCRVHDGKHSAKFLNFAECQKLNTRQSFPSLPSVRNKTLGKVSQVCRVSELKHSANKLQRSDFMVTLPSVHWNTLGKEGYQNGKWSLF